jgi:AAA family ATP:ADP antiporter
MASEGRARYALIAATTTAALLIAQQVAAKAVRDAFFLSRFDSANLPPAMAAAAVIGVGSALVVGRMMVRHGPARYVPWLFGVQVLLFALEYAASAFAPAQVAVVLYLHVAALAPVLASAFWSAVNERFDPYTARRVFGRIGAGATFGGVVGGLATERLAHVFPISRMLPGIALLNLLGLAGALVLRAGPVTAEPRAAPLESGLAVLRRTPYLRHLAALVVVLAVTDSWLDYVFKAEAGSKYGSGQALLGFFALFYTATAILTFAVQVLLNRYALRELGLGGAVAALPGAVLIAGVASVAAPGLGSAGLLRGLSAVVESSLYRSGYELLYTPLPALAKRATKAVLDVAMSRIGTAIGSGVALAAVAFVPGHSHRLLLAGCVVLSAFALLLALRLHAGYVAQLAASLRMGVVRLDSSQVFDRTTMQTLAETAGALDRAELLRQIEAARARAIGPPAVAVSPTTEPPRPRAHSSVPPASADLSERAAALSSVDRERARGALRAPLAPELTGLALRWLSDDSLAHAVHAALEPLAGRCTGQLLDSLLDHSQPITLRRRLPRLLGTVDGERVQRGLFAALDDASFEIRERCAQALSTIAGRKGTSVLSEAEILAVIERELARDEPPLATVPPPSGDAPASLGGRTVALVFALLGLCFDRGVVALCLQAILGPDSLMRGTALEYLDNVLPGPIRDKLWPRLRAARSERPRRSRQSIVQDLLTASQSEQAGGTSRS